MKQAKPTQLKMQRISAKVDTVSQSVKLTGDINGKFNDVMIGMSGQVMMSPPQYRFIY